MPLLATFRMDLSPEAEQHEGPQRMIAPGVAQFKWGLRVGNDTDGPGLNLCLRKHRLGTWEICPAGPWLMPELG